MMGGLGMSHGHGLGLGIGGHGGLGLTGLLGGTRDIRDMVENRVGELKSDVESGRVDVTYLQNRLVERFGEATQGIVGDDGAIDFDKLVEVITRQRIDSYQDRLVARFGDDAEGILGDDGSIDTEGLRDLIVARRTEAFEVFADRRIEKLQDRVEAGKVDLAKLQERLTERYGEAAAGIVGIDGHVDYDAIKALMVEHRVDRLNGRLDKYFGADENLFDLDMLRDVIVAEKTARYENTADRLIGRLKEWVDAGEVDLATLQERLTRRFGEEAAGIVGIDGTIDYDAIRSLYVESRVERLEERLDARFDRDGILGGDLLRDLVVADRTERFAAIADRLIERLQERVAAGEVDLADLQDRLSDRFGEDAAGIVGIDGTIDYDAIKGLIVDRLTERLNERLDAPGAVKELIGPDELRDLIVAHHTERYAAFADRVIERIQQRLDDGDLDLEGLQERLTKRFGEDAAGIVGIDGTIDTDRLKQLVVDGLVERLNTRFDAKAEEDGAVDTGLLRDIIVAHRTERYEDRAERRVARLEERVEAGKVDLETLQERLTERYGEDAAGIVGIDGTVDYDAIKQLIVDAKVARLEERLDRRFGTAGTDGDEDDDTHAGFILARDRLALPPEEGFRGQHYGHQHHGENRGRPFFDVRA